MSARNFKGTNECHGWMGVRFQAHPRDQDSQIIIHVRMLDTENALQQEALGIVGVNLLYGAFFLHHEPDKLIESLLDNLTTQRIEIDMIEFSGIAFRHVDNRVMSLQLVQLGLSGAAMFGPTGEVLQPSEVLYKKPILVERGSFRPVTHVNVDMLRCARGRSSRASPSVGGERASVSLMEITMRNLRDGRSGEIDLRDFLARADMLAACGQDRADLRLLRVLPAGRLPGPLHQAARSASRWAPPACASCSTRSTTPQLDGGILESFGRLFKNDLKLYVYPLLDPATRPADDGREPAGRARAAQALRVPGRARLHRAARQFQPRLPAHLLARRARADQARRPDAGRPMVPPEVAEVIKHRGFFGYRPKDPDPDVS